MQDQAPLAHDLPLPRSPLTSMYSRMLDTLHPVTVAGVTSSISSLAVIG